jgi:hypothetical protein
VKIVIDIANDFFIVVELIVFSGETKFIIIQLYNEDTALQGRIQDFEKGGEIIDCLTV